MTRDPESVRGSARVVRARNADPVSEQSGVDRGRRFTPELPLRIPAAVTGSVRIPRSHPEGSHIAPETPSAVEGGR